MKAGKSSFVFRVESLRLARELPNLVGVTGEALPGLEACTRRGVAVGEVDTDVWTWSAIEGIRSLTLVLDGEGLVLLVVAPVLGAVGGVASSEGEAAAVEELAVLCIGQ